MRQLTTWLKASIILVLFCFAFSFVVIPSHAMPPSIFGPVRGTNVSVTSPIQQNGSRLVASSLRPLASQARPDQHGTDGLGQQVEGTSQILATSPGLNAWTELGPKPLLDPNMQNFGTAPFSGRVTAIAINSSNPSNIYLGAAQGGVWKSLDGGTNWAPVTDFQTSLAIGAITISPDGKTLYAGTGEPNHSGDSYYGAGLLKSVDGGKSWTVLGSSSFSNAAISGIVISQGVSRILVSTTRAVCCKIGYSVTSASAEGVFLSTDGGTTWSSTLSSPSSGVAQLMVDPSNQNTIYAADFTGAVWISTDTGSTWANLISYTSPALQGRVAVAASAALANTLFAAFVDSSGELIGVFRYNIKTDTLTELGQPPTPSGQGSACNTQCWYDLLLVSDPSNSNYLYLGTIDLFRSSDGGNSWTDIGGYSGTIHPDQHGFAFLQGTSSTIFSGNDGGIWKSTDRGTSWTNLNNGLGTIQFESITGSPGSLLFGGTQDNGCDQYTGTSWSIIQGGDGGWTGFESSNPSIMYCNYAFLQFQKSIDGGKTWNPADTGINLDDTSLFYAPVAQDPNTAGTIYIGGTHIYRTTNFAKNWTDASGILGSSRVTALTVAPSNSKWVFLGDSSGTVKVSRDGGATWQQILTPQNVPVTGLAVDPSSSSTVYASFAHLGLYSISLVGGSWQSMFLNSPQADVNVVRLDPSTKAIYIGTDSGVYYSTDSGSSWASPGTGLPNSAVFDLDYVPATRTLVAATHGRGVWSLIVMQALMMTLSYSVRGGGSGYSAPTLSYTSGGQAKVATLTGSPTPFVMDTGTSWSIADTLAGSSASERWHTNQVTTGTPETQPITFVYYHQSLTTLGYSVVGGAGYVTPTAPTVNANQYGTNISLSLGSNWVDSGSPFAYPTQLQSTHPNSQERWLASSPIGSISSEPTIRIQYYHQVMMTVSYSVLGGGSPSAPTFSYFYVGAGSSIGLTGNPKSVWLDTNNYSVTDPLVGSGSTERWSAFGTGQDFGSPRIFIYVHQYHVDVSGGIVTESWFDAGSTAKVNTTGVSGRNSGVGSRVYSYSLDGGFPITVTPTTGAITVQIMMDAPHSLLLNTLQQFELTLDAGAQRSLSSVVQPTITGDDYWYDAGTVVIYTGNGVFERASGSGSRATSWSLDSGQSSGIATAGTFSPISISMAAPHALRVAVVTQYQLSLDQGANVALKSITSPTLSQDNYWFDAGTEVQVDLNGVWDRVSGTGNRLLSYAINGGASTPVATSGGVAVLSATMGSAQSISTSVSTQFLLEIHSGSLVSVTQPTIHKDVGWYDSGTAVEAVYNYVWNVTQSSRVTGFGYSVGAAPNTNLARNGNGTFAVNLSMDKPQTITIAFLSQFRLDVSGGGGLAFSVPSPTGDVFYDSGTSVSVRTARTWNLEGGSRQNLISYILDGIATNVTGAETGDYNTPPIFMNQHHSLAFNNVTQYLVTFSFTDNTGIQTITPSAVEIDVNGVGIQAVAGSKVWINGGGSFAITKLIWENVDVRPAIPQIYGVSSPTNVTTRTRVFELSLDVTDPFGQPVSGASVSLLLANGTRIERNTGSDGKVSIPLIPAGTFNGTITNLGVSSQVHGDASTQAASEGKVAMSILLLGIVGGIVVIAVAGVFLGVRRRRVSDAGGSRTAISAKA